jgi:hypothetical protein
MCTTIHRIALISLLCLGFSAAHADQITVDGTTIERVVVNGGTDTANAGTTCLRISSTVSAACTNGYIAINNSNKNLIAAALAAKATGALIMLYYDTGWGSFHCPGLAMTPCSVISISLK